MKAPARPAAGTLVILALCASYAVYCLATMPPGPVTAPDSSGYLAFAPIHVLGYPLFLKLLGARGAMIAQPIIFSVALASLGVETLRLTSSWLLAAAVVVASTAVPELKTYHYSVLTESLFISGLLAFLAALVRFVRKPSLASLARLSIIAALTAIVRQTGMAMVPVVPIVVLMYWHELRAARLKVLAAAVMPFVVIYGGERAAARVLHGDRITSLMGRHLFAKAALIDAPTAPSASADPQRAHFDQYLDVTYAGIRTFLDAAPRNIRGVLTLYYETCLQGPCVPELGTTSAAFTERGLNDDLGRAGRGRIARAPVNFVWLTVEEYRSLWTGFRLRHPETAPALTAFVAAHRPLPFEREVFKVGPGDAVEFRGTAAVRFIQPVVFTLGWITGAHALLALAAAAARRPLPRRLAVACLASLTAHGALLFTALFAAGIGRFMLGVWPVVAVSALFGVAFVAASVRDV